MIYLDNAATTHRKPLSVIFNTLKAMTIDSVNAGRGGYKLSIRAENKILDTRENFKHSFNLKSVDNVIFTSGATMSINLALMGTKKTGGHIVATMYEHNSVLRTLEYLKTNFNISYTLVAPRSNGVINADDIKDAINENTYLIVTNHTSNVVGFDCDIAAIGKIAKKHGLMYMVDGAQSVGHKTIDMQACNINMLAIAGHKGLYAPQGIGVLLINNVTLTPLIMGGTGTYSDSLVQPIDLPEGLESGTHNLPGIYGLNAGLKFVTKNKSKINDKIHMLTSYLLDSLKHIQNVVLYSNNLSSGVVAFNIKGKTSAEVSDILSSKYNIAVRAGLHCAPMVHKHFGTMDTGMVRVSISYYTTKMEIAKLIKAIKTLV